MHRAINEYHLRLDVQRFLWPVNCIIYTTYTWVLYFASWGVNTTSRVLHTLRLCVGGRNLEVIAYVAEVDLPLSNQTWAVTSFKGLMNVIMDY